MCSRVWLGLQLLKIMEVKTVMRRQKSTRHQKGLVGEVGRVEDRGLPLLSATNSRGMSPQQGSKVGSSYVGPLT